MYEPLSEIENKLYKNFTQINEKPAITLEELKSELLKIRSIDQFSQQSFHQSSRQFTQ